jgi:hypothetical protein
MEQAVIFWILSIICLGAGFVGLLLPVLPGPPLLIAGFVLGAWAEDFQYISWGSLSVLIVLSLSMYLVDFLSTLLGAKKYGASNRALIGATIGGGIGIFFGFLGIIVGPFIGAVIGELSVQGDALQAGRSGIGTTLGLVISVAAKLAIAFSMILGFIFIRFF